MSLNINQRRVLALEQAKKNLERYLSPEMDGTVFTKKTLKPKYQKMRKSLTKQKIKKERESFVKKNVSQKQVGDEIIWSVPTDQEVKEYIDSRFFVTKEISLSQKIRRTKKVISNLERKIANYGRYDDDFSLA